MYRSASSFGAYFDASDFLENTSSASGSVRSYQVRSGQPGKFVSTAGASPKADVIQISAARLSATTRALAELRRYAQFDGANQNSFEAAEKFLDLVRRSLSGGSVYVQFFGGNAVLNFETGLLKAQFEFLSDGSIAANIDTNDDEWDEDVTGFDGKSLPSPIAERLSAVRSA